MAKIKRKGLVEADNIPFALPTDALNDPNSVNFKDIMGKQRKDHEAKLAAEAEAKRKEELRAKYADLLNKVAEAEDKHEVLFDKLVPGSGACDTVAGELIRAITKIMYRDWNDGDLFYEGYGIETAGNAATYLSDHGFEDEIIHIAEMQLEDDAYTKALTELDNKIVQYIIDNPELLETPLDYDMYDTDSEWLKDYQPRYEYSYGVSEKIEAYLDAGIITSWDCIQVVEEWIQYDSAFEDAEVSRPWGHSDKEYNIENLTREGLERCQEWERWNMWEDYENDLYDQYGDPNDEDEEDEDEFDESLNLKESTWAEKTTEFTKGTQKKLEIIHAAGLFDDLEDAIEDNKDTYEVILGLFTDVYRVPKTEYSKVTDEQIKVAKKTMFKLINDFYKKATEKTSGELTEAADEEFNPIAYMENMPKLTQEDADFAQGLIGDAGLVVLDTGVTTSYMAIKARTNDYVDSGIVNVSEKFIKEFTAYIENKYEGYTARPNNMANIYWLTNKR